MAKVMILSRSRDRWVGWRMEPTKFEADTPAHEVLLRVARENPDLMVAIASQLAPTTSDRLENVAQIPLPEFLAS